ncbi:MAG: hypothetical protein KBC63_03415 [Candidatus Levybacteria bacterium]|nr:hypothetical protein [Candidatus Levybacteria bacterium]
MSVKERQLVKRIALGGASAIGLAAALSPLAAIGAGDRESVLIPEQKPTVEVNSSKEKIIFEATPDTTHDSSIPRYPQGNFGSYEEHERPRKNR